MVVNADKVDQFVNQGACFLCIEGDAGVSPAIANADAEQQIGIHVRYIGHGQVDATGPIDDRWWWSEDAHGRCSGS